jgi:hypothetical protein
MSASFCSIGPLSGFIRQFAQLKSTGSLNILDVPLVLQSCQLCILCCIWRMHLVSFIEAAMAVAAFELTPIGIVSGVSAFCPFSSLYT